MAFEVKTKRAIFRHFFDDGTLSLWICKAYTTLFRTRAEVSTTTGDLMCGSLKVLTPRENHPDKHTTQTGQCFKQFGYILRDGANLLRHNY